ncbi:hypothetical protein SAMN06298216_0598 [Spirosomataceae bacterium TFI 002]|nr:hypothetical protein SAMN06298216_0598 [Spirosomataceae bacterium TFI 002]
MSKYLKRYRSFCEELKEIDKELITDAQVWVYKELCKKLNLKVETSLPEILKGSKFKRKEKGQEEEFEFYSKIGFGKGAISKFRFNYTKLVADSELQKFIEHVAFYWIALEIHFPEVRFTISQENQNQIHVQTGKDGIVFPVTANTETDDYICFYPRSKTDLADRVGVMEVNMQHDKTDLNNVRSGVFGLTAYYRTGKISISGRWLEQGMLTYLRTRRRSTGKIYLKKNNKRDEGFHSKIIHTQLNCQRSPLNENYMLGQMLSANREHEFSFAVAVVMVKKDYYEKSFNGGKKVNQKHFEGLILSGSSIPAEIAYYLFNKRLSTQQLNSAENFEDTLPTIGESAAMKNIAGKYLGYRLSQVLDSEVYMTRFGIEIQVNGLVRFLDREDQQKNGYVRHVNTYSQHGGYRLLIQLGIDENTFAYQQTFCLETHSSQSEYLKGNFLIGLGDSPLAGKIYFEKKQELSAAYPDELFTIDGFKSSFPQEVVDYFSRDKKSMPGYALFYTRAKLDLPYFLPNKLSIFCFSKVESQNSQDEFPNRKPLIEKMNLVIENGQFQLYNGFQSSVSGEVKLKRNFLVLATFNSDRHEVFHFSIKTILQSNFVFEYAFGTNSLFSDMGHPESRAAVLTPMVDEVKMYHIYDEEYISAFLYKRNQDFNASEFAAFKFLMGTEINKMIRMPSLANKPDQKRYDLYRKMYFFAADYIANKLLDEKQAKSGYIQSQMNQIKRNLTMSKWQGFMSTLNDPKTVQEDKEMLDKLLKKLDVFDNYQALSQIFEY